MMSISKLEQFVVWRTTVQSCLKRVQRPLDSISSFLAAKTVKGRAVVVSCLLKKITKGESQSCFSQNNPLFVVSLDVCFSLQR